MLKLGAKVEIRALDGSMYFVYSVTSVSDPDPCGSVLKWLPWIRIRICIGNTDPDPDPGQSKWSPTRKIKLRF